MQLWRYGHAIDRLGHRYSLRGLLGSGAMADVCLAWDEHERREVAIKVIKSDVLDQKTLNSFLKEASQVVGWRHPNILPVYEDMKLQLLDAKLGSIVPYIVMEYARGGDLQRRLTLARPYPLGETLRIFGQLCSAVQYAHEHGVIHRDLKPLNILFRQLPNGTEQVVLSDFGLSVNVDAAHQTFSQAGTLEYMAPEQFRGVVEPSSDIFALGVILYQLCTGQVPFKRSLADLKHIGAQELPPRPSIINLLLPGALDDVIMTAFAEKPIDRHRNAAEFWQCVRMAVLSPSQKSALAEQTGNARTFGSSLNVTMPVQRLGEVGRSSTTGGYIPGDSAFDLSERMGKITRNFPIPDADERSTKKIPISEMRDKTTGGMPAQTLEAGPVSMNGVARRSHIGQAIAGASVTLAEVPAEMGRSSDVIQESQNGTAKNKKNTPRRQPFLLLIATLVFLLLLVLAGIIADMQGKLGSLAGLLPGASATSIVTITPDSKVMENVFAVDAVTGSADALQQQVEARRVTATSQAQSTTVQATGVGQNPGVKATGSLTFTNATGTVVTVPAGKVFTDARGVQVTFDSVVTIPQASSTPGKVNVPAHAVVVGTNGDITANDIAQSCCAPGVTVNNSNTFSGGQNPQNFTVVQQSDIDGAAKSLESSLSQSVQAALQDQLASSERFISPAQCSSKVTSDVPARSKATAVTVTVVVECIGEVYDQRAVQSIVAVLLSQDAVTSLGTHYALVGNVEAVVTQVAVNNADQGTTTLLVKAQGVWVYHFSLKEQQELVRLILGNSKRGAEDTLLKQVGVAKLNIQLSSNYDTKMPSDPGQIKIVVQSVQGVREPLSPMAVPGTHP